jgi:hypothetical protein
MRVRNRVLNISEEIVLKELSAISADNSLRIFPKLRLSDVIEKDIYLEPEYFTYYTSSHFDFLVTDGAAKPFMAIEYDGPYHRNDAEQIVRDVKKNLLCKQAGLPILRVNANHVLRKYREMTLLRWIIEVIKLEEWFNEAQEKGQIPFDEPFDAQAIAFDGKRQWPYWLSARANLQINEFVRDNRQEKRGRAALIGQDDDQNLHSLEYIRSGDQVLYVRTSVRNQGVNINHYDLIDQVTDAKWENDWRASSAGSSN